jgi:hypothetical protein
MTIPQYPQHRTTSTTTSTGTGNAAEVTQGARPGYVLPRGYSGPGSAARDGQQRKLKRTAQTVNNTDTLQNDTDLFFTAATNSVYEIKLVVRYTSGTTPDLKFGWTLPSGATLEGWMIGYNSSSVYTVRPAATADHFGGLGADMVFTLEALVITTTAGIVQFQWAQNTPDASDTTVLANSLLFYTKI